jgi:hypothetical protein
MTLTKTKRRQTRPLAILPTIQQNDHAGRFTVSLLWIEKTLTDYRTTIFGRN